MSLLKTHVAKAEKVASNVIYLQIARPEGFSWRTGEFAMLGLKVGEEQVMRCYSIASVGNSETVDFFIANVKGGQLSPKMNALKDGDEVYLDSEVGGMLLADRLEQGGKDLWLFGSGTGVAPFMAVTSDSAIMDRYENVILVHGVRTWDETGYVARMIRRSPKLQVICAVTREPNAMITKRIPDALADGSLQSLAGIQIEKDHSRAMLCGNPGMVKGVRDYLKSLGMVSPRGGNPGQVLVENFWI
ncbi:MAG TPA: ferredoxin--NADP reductase [Sutterella sp.]|nr:ferredoxin--NADP reductase [Sutterella sp.]